MIYTAVLMTCHNRRDQTLDCLGSLYKNKLPENMILDVFLVDDGSTDGTSQSIRKKYPDINLISGNGSLFWNQGMRLAWEKASNSYNYDYYLWMNDDVILNDFALTELFNCCTQIFFETGLFSVITGAFKHSANENVFSYGGRNLDEKPIIPDGTIQSCTYINGNAVVVPREIFNKLGFLSNDYTHAMGDFDYGLRAIKFGFSCYTTTRYVGICPEHEKIDSWCDPEVPLLKRWKTLHSPKGLNIREYSVFRKKFFGNKWIIFLGKAYLKTIVPKLYKKLTPEK